MSDTTNVCRLCLNIVLPDKFSAFDATITQKLQLLIPSLTLTPVTNLVICNDCHESLEESSKLKRTCSSSNKLIKFLKNYLGVSHAVELKELIKGNNKKQEENWPKYGYVCRICLKSNEGQYTSIADAKTEEFGEVFSSCIFILEENLTTNPLICKVCIDILHKMCAFVKQCHDVEERVNSYSKSVPGEVDLFKLINYANEGLTGQNAEASKEKAAPNEEERPSTEQPAENPKEHEEECLNDEVKLLIEEQDKDISKSAPADHADEGFPLFRIGTDLILQPYKRRPTFLHWLDKVEKFKLKQHLSDLTVMQKIIEFMKDLSPQVQEYFLSSSQGLSWPEFKEKLLRAFPDRNDYHANVDTLIRIKRKRRHSFVAYYERKMAVMKPLNFSEEQMVSFLIGGIPTTLYNIEGRIAQCKTSQELLAYFKVWDEREAQATINPRILRLRSFQICECCDQNGHCSADCPFVGNKAHESQKITDDTHQNSKEFVAPENQTLLVPSPEKKRRGGRKNAAAKKAAREKLQNASKRASEQKAAQEKPQGASKRASEEKVTQETPQEACKRASEQKAAQEKLQSASKRASEQKAAQEKPQGARKRASEQKAAQETPQDASKRASEQKAAQEKPEGPMPIQSGPRCACCDKFGHSSMTCPMLRNKAWASRTEKCNSTIDEVIVIDDAMPEQEGDSSPKQKCESSPPKPQAAIEMVPDKEKVSRPIEEGREPDGGDSVGEVDTRKKCSCCDKLGHTSVNCPFIVAKNENANARGQKCFNCKKLGHKLRECPDRKVKTGEESGEPPRTCWKCKETGHLSGSCPLVKSSSASKAGSSSQIQKEAQKRTAAETANKNTETLPNKCWHCKQSGHLFKDCPIANGNSFKASTSSNNWQLANQPQMQTAAHTPNMAPTGNSAAHTPNMAPTGNYWNFSQSVYSFGNYPVPNSNNYTVGMANNTWQPQQQIAPQTPNLNAQLPPRCLGCNQFGHLVQNCPLSNGNALKGSRWQMGNEPQKQAPAQTWNTPAEEQPPNCWFCKQPGHMFQSCPMFKNNVVKAQEKIMWQNIEKCTTCNIYGHSSSNCPVVEAVKVAAMPWMAQPPGEPKVQAPPPQNKPNRKRRCLCCNNVDHSSLDCPLLKNNKSSMAKQPGNPHKPQEPEKCLCCGKTEHPTWDCPYYSLFKAANSKKDHGEENEEKSAAKRAKLEEKCYFCDQVGHSSSDCFRTRFERKGETAARPKTPELQMSQISYTDPSVVVMSSQNMAVCEFCKKIGHSVSECFEASFNQKTSGHCLNCGKFGHLPSDCPKKRQSSGSSKTSRTRKRKH